MLNSCSAQGKGVHAMGIETFAFQPLNAFSDNADSIHADAKADILKIVNGVACHPGLVDQYNLQLARIDPEHLLPVCEIVGIAGHMTMPSMLVLPHLRYSCLIMPNSC